MPKSQEQFRQKADATRPYEDVPLTDDPDGLKVRVYSVRLADARHFADKIGELTERVFREAADPEGRVTEQAVASRLGRIALDVLTDLSDLVADACVAWEGKNYEDPENRYEGALDLPELDLAVQSSVAAAWIRVSYLGGRFRPLAAVVEELIEHTTGKKVSIQSMLSRFWSAAGSPSGRFSTSGGTAGPTPAGPSQSSDSTSGRPAASTPPT